jgi:hypothetical protein
MTKRMTQRMGASVATPFLMAGVLVGACMTTEPEILPSLATSDQAIAQQMSVDSQYMTKQFQAKDKTNGVGDMLSVDLSDPAQHRFVMNRLAAAGKTDENSPELFERIKKSRDKAITRKNSTTSAELVTNATGIFCAQFVILGNETKPTTTTIRFPGTHPDVSCVGGASYLYSDVTTYNSNPLDTENFVVASAAGEQYDAGTAFNAVQISPSLPAQLGRTNKTDSLLIAYDPLGVTEQITYSVVLSDIVPTPGSILLQHPVLHPQVQNGGEIQMCQLRGTEAQCDYRIGNLGTGGGFVQFGSPVNRIAEVGTINPWVPDLTTSFAFPAPFNAAHVYLPTVGVLDVGAAPTGNCAIKSILSAQFHLFKTLTGGVCDTVAQFKQSFVLTLNPRKATFSTISDFTNDGGTSTPPGAVNCSLSPIVNDRVKPSMVISARAHCGEFTPSGQPIERRRVITLSPEGTSPIPNFVKFINSCFAEGTKIRNAAGKLASIEKVKVGDKVAADTKGTLLTVTAISKGIENDPIVSIRDNKGHALRLTAQHPVLKASGEVVAASTIQKDDRVMTDRGIATIVSAERAPYTGQVYNLELGTKEERAKVGKNGTTMFAGGFLVGDSTMQEDGSKARRAVAAASPAWSRDYQNALQNNPPMIRILQ